ncbi:MAG: SDR family NAD(P)-dependent oxidoreductase [Gammaproteobacteria bacterium]
MITDTGARPLAGRHALITGATRGIGRQTALAYARAGAALTLCARTRRDLDLLADELRAGGTQVRIVVADLARREDVDALARAATDVDIVVNNAAAKARFASVLGADDAHWDEHIAVNLMAPLKLLRVIGAAMAERGRGVIITFSSSAAIQPVPFIGAYAVTKRATEYLTRLAAMELGPRGVRAVCLAPGLTVTETVQHLFESGQAASWTSNTPLGRVAQSQEMAGLIVWLASDAAAYLTGTTVVVDGGNTTGQYHLLAASAGALSADDPCARLPGAGGNRNT